jgi:hypothetical protein
MIALNDSLLKIVVFKILSLFCVSWIFLLFVWMEVGQAKARLKQG